MNPWPELSKITIDFDSSTDEFGLMPGVYHYSFACDLPVGLPTSLEGDVGYVRYTVRICLDIPRWPDIEFEENFTVIKPLNLNYDVELRVSRGSQIIWRL